MGKTSIHISCLDQRLIVTTGPVIASGGKNEDKVIFAFCPLWEGFQKVASFWRDKEDVYAALIDDENSCIIPWEVLTDEGEFFFAVFGVKDDITRTSNTVKYKVAEGAITEATEVSDPTPDMYEQILAAYHNVLTDMDDRFKVVNQNIATKAPTDHVHGDITNDGRVGSIADHILTTSTGGKVIASDPEEARKKLGLAAVAASGSYKDLSDKPDGLSVDTTVDAGSDRAVSGAAVSKYITERIETVKSTAETVTVAADIWTGEEAPFSAVVASTLATADNHLIVGAGGAVSAEQQEAMAAAMIICTAQANGSITLTAYGDKPEINLPVNIICVG